MKIIFLFITYPEKKVFRIECPQFYVCYYKVRQSVLTKLLGITHCDPAHIIGGSLNMKKPPMGY
jgi:hypothetical protein